MNRTDRLFGILLMLQTERRTRARDIAQKFGISERTVYRDVQALSELGVPVVSLPGEGYELMEGYHLPPVILSEDEAGALFFAGRMFTGQAIGRVATYAELALRKIRAILPPHTVEILESLEKEVHFYVENERFDLDAPYLDIVRGAIKAHRVLRIRYQSIADAHRQTDTERDIEPLTLTYSSGAWFLSAFCRLRNDLRSFRLNRVRGLGALEETFTPRIVYAPSPSTIEVRVHFRADVIPRVIERQHYGYQRSESEDEEGAVMVYTVDTLNEIRNWLFGWGTQAKVLSPQTLRNDLRDEARRLWEMLK
jgi:predicted DNA-binding transcriptional regulator YafY